MKGANWYKLFLAQTSTSNISVFNLRLRLSSASVVSVSSVSALIVIIELWLFFLSVLPHCWLLLNLWLTAQIRTSGSNSSMFWSVISPTFRRAGRLIPLYMFFAHLHLRLVGVFSIDSAVYQDIYHTDGKAQLFLFPFPPQFEPNAW
jgi:hypothetical protein